MTGSLVLILLLFLTFLVFFIPKPAKYHYALLLLISGEALTSWWALKLFSGTVPALQASIPLSGGSIVLTMDKLSAFFLVVINITVLAGFLYARGYLKPYTAKKSSLHFSIHYLSYLWLYFSMVLVVMIRDGFLFLAAWEIMALSSFFLVIFDAEDRKIMKTGISYLIQMHAGMFFILTAFLIAGKATGEMNFDALKLYFTDHRAFPLFLLFFTGFGIKAGFIPLHTWLPEAHPAAPSHVSGVMSGVMIKMGIYGILRVLMHVQDDLLLIGIFILLVSLVSGILGVMMAIVQHDLKRLLAYHSIENIGIIGIGIGLGMIGTATGNPGLALLGYAGGILHILNHSLFKSLLFFSAGSVYKATHTRNMEQLGGLMKKMPMTAGMFLLGSLAICGLPPFNGFISEYLIYIGMFKSLSAANLYQSILILSAIVGLSMIGGLAIFCFTKAFGISFLGTARSSKAENAGEADIKMILPQLIPVIFILLIGMASPLFLKPVLAVVSQSFGTEYNPGQIMPMLNDLQKISLISGILIVLVTTGLILRRVHLSKKIVDYGPTWGCGYTAGTSRQQYTATSFAYNYNHLAKPVLGTEKVMEEIREEEIFPSPRHFESHSDDMVKKHLVDRPVDWLFAVLKKLAVMQTGKVQHYILYAFVFMLVVFLLTFLNIF